MSEFRVYKVTSSKKLVIFGNAKPARKTKKMVNGREVTVTDLTSLSESQGYVAHLGTAGTKDLKKGDPFDIGELTLTNIPVLNEDGEDTGLCWAI